MYCEKCGAKLQDDSIFCEKCGTKVNNGSSTEPPCIPQEERKAFLNALGERGFTAHVELGFYEYEYIVGGEVHVEPKPMY